MKFNLKNKPMTIGNRIKMGVKPSKIEWGKIVAEWEFWASGFEKELREKLNPPKVIEANKDDEVVRWVLKAQNTLIKEILGE